MGRNIPAGDHFYTILSRWQGMQYRSDLIDERSMLDRIDNAYHSVYFGRHLFRDRDERCGLYRDRFSPGHGYQGDYRQALAQYKLHITYRDSINNEDNTRKAVELRMQYDFDKKQVADSLQFARDKEVGALKLRILTA